ncbi:outer membrane beta-barrel protein [Pedobacter frigiditerrae]|uniref:outer membrane beta-barrel protein n=1 Tax=Pedobacter frigiditerrae TaxID=2530452 RepID=UPI002931A27A|nr:outer membrane beta-barrel protein [Pedobacter frigiditerrae]
MKKSTKFLASAAAALALFFSIDANAQSAPKFGIGLNVGAGVGTGQSFAIGGDLRYQFDVDKQLSIPITAGYTNIQYKDAYGDISFGYIPVKAGLKYFFNDTGAGVYGLAEAGAAFGVGDYSGTDFVYSPALGYAWSNGLDLAAKYEGIASGGTNGYVGIRLAYGFKL